MKFNQIFNNFSSGEWSPKMRGRSDVQQYANACETLTNFIPQVSGGAFKRRGTEYLSMDATSAGKINNANSQHARIFYWAPAATPYIVVAPLAIADWFILPHNGGTGTAITVGSVSIPLPSSLRTVAIGDILVFVDSSGLYEPFVLYMNSGTPTLAKWHSYVDTQNALDEHHSFPYRDVEANGSSHTIEASATTGNITLTASTAFFLSSAFEGAYFKLGNTTSTGVVRVTSRVSDTVVNATVLKALPLGAGSPYGSATGTFWEESAWSDYRGWPKTLTTFQGRLIFGGNSSKPDTIWGSRIGNYFDMMEIPFTQDDEYLTFAEDNSRPFSLTPSAAESSTIVGLTSAKTLLVNTTKYEIVASGTQGALGPLDVSFESSTSFGAYPTQPVRVNNFTTFVEIGGTKLRDIVFSYNEDQYKSTDLSFVANHFLGEQGVYDVISQMAVTRRNNILWCRLSSGRVLGVTLDRDYQVNGWFRIKLADNANVFGIASGGPNLDFLYLLVNRDTGVCVERLLCSWEDADIDGNYLVRATNVHLDAHTVTISVTPGTTFGPFPQLKGKTVSVIGDGFYLGEYEVSNDVSAQIVLDTTVNTTLAVGLPYQAILKTMPSELGQQLPGGSQGLMKRISEINVKFWKTYGAKYGRKEDDLFDINFKDTTTPMDTPQPLFTGTKSLKFPGNYDQEVQVIIKQDKPWPCNVLSIGIRGQTND